MPDWKRKRKGKKQTRDKPFKPFSKMMSCAAWALALNLALLWPCMNFLPLLTRSNKPLPLHTFIQQYYIHGNQTWKTHCRPKSKRNAFNPKASHFNQNHVICWFWLLLFAYCIIFSVQSLKTNFTSLSEDLLLPSLPSCIFKSIKNPIWTNLSTIGIVLDVILVLWITIKNSNTSRKKSTRISDFF